MDTVLSRRGKTARRRCSGLDSTLVAANTLVMATAAKRIPVARPSRKWSVASLGGAVVSAFLASACCLGPLLFAVLGIGGAGLLVKIEPYRPCFAGLTLGLLGLGFFFTYRAPRTSADDGAECACEHPRSNRTGRILLWLTTVLVIVFVSFPYVAGRLFE